MKNIGTTAMNKASESELKEAIMGFVCEYGMLGLMTALPTTPDFITYEAVYLPKNYFIKKENISTERYLSYFFPFDKIDFRKKGIESSWSTGSPENDGTYYDHEKQATSSDDVFLYADR